MQIEVFEAREQQVRDAFLAALSEEGSSLIDTCSAMEADLRRLAEIFSHFPSILDQRSLGSAVHSMDTLIEVMYRDGCEHTILLPTKVIVGRSFVVAKFNFFGFLINLCGRYETLEIYREELQRTWELVIFSLLIEDVYQVIIQPGGDYDPRIRRQAAVDLIHMWEYRFDQHVNDYAPTIVDLWRARKRIVPVFGTMLGTMELVGLSSLLPERWYEFIARYGEDEEVMHALEEFIFGLTYEDIVHVRERMAELDISAVDRNGLQTMLGVDNTIQEINSTDPREMYRFFQRRTRRMTERRLSNAPGPRKTLEEVFLAYLIEETLTPPGEDQADGR